MVKRRVDDDEVTTHDKPEWTPKNGGTGDGATSPVPTVLLPTAPATNLPLLSSVTDIRRSRKSEVCNLAAPRQLIPLVRRDGRGTDTARVLYGAIVTVNPNCSGRKTTGPSSVAKLFWVTPAKPVDSIRHSSSPAPLMPK